MSEVNETLNPVGGPSVMKQVEFGSLKVKDAFVYYETNYIKCDDDEAIVDTGDSYVEFDSSELVSVESE